METKKEPGSNAPPLANRNQIDPGTGVMSQPPGTSIAESLDMWQTMNQGPVSRPQQEELLQGSLKVPSALPGGPSGAIIPHMPGPLIGNSNPMSGSVGTNGPGGPTGTLRTNMYSKTQPQQPQQLTLQNPMSYQQHQLMMLQKLQQQQQQHQQLHSLSLQGKMHMSTTPMGGMQRNQMNSGQQQPLGQGGSFQHLTLMSQQQQQPQAAMQNPYIPAQQINNATGLQQQQRLQMQQNQQQSQMPQNQILNQHVMLGQQQSQMMGNGGGNMNFMQMQTQKRLQLLQQQQKLLQQQQQQQQWQPPRFQLPLQQQLLAQQQQQRMMQQQPMHRSSAPLQAQNGIAIDPQRQQQQQLIPQQQQLQRQQRGIADGAYSSASMESTAQTRNPGDWQEEIHQKLTHLKDTYLADLADIHQRLSTKLSQLDNVVLANAREGDKVEKMKQFKLALERMMTVLQLGKQRVNIGMKDKLAMYEKQILHIIQTNRKAPQPLPPPRKSQLRKCEVCIDCVHKRRNS